LIINKPILTIMWRIATTRRSVHTADAVRMIRTAVHAPRNGWSSVAAAASASTAPCCCCATATAAAAPSTITIHQSYSSRSFHSSSVRYVQARSRSAISRKSAADTDKRKAEPPAAAASPAVTPPPPSTPQPTPIPPRHTPSAAFPSIPFLDPDDPSLTPPSPARIRELLSVRAREAELEAAALADYAATGRYRKPKIKKSGKAYERAQKELEWAVAAGMIPADAIQPKGDAKGEQQVDSAAEAASASVDENVTEQQPFRIEYDDPSALNAEVEEPSEDVRARRSTLVRGVVQKKGKKTSKRWDRDSAAAEDGLEEEDERRSGTDGKNRQSGAASDLPPVIQRFFAEQAKAQFESIMPPEKGAKDQQEEETTEEVPQPSAEMIARVESQLRELESAAVATGHASPSVGGGGFNLGFDSIDLSSTRILEDEVLEPRIKPTKGVSKIMSDPSRRSSMHRIERVTEKTKEIIARVLLEESIKIDAINKAKDAAQKAKQSQAAPPHSTSTSRRPQYVDFRTLPSFRIRSVRYSSDLVWLHVSWTLGKDGFSGAHMTEGEERIMRQQSQAQEKESQSSSSTSSTSSSPASTSLPSWWETRRSVSATLNHLSSRFRAALARGLDLKYTPSLRFTYDDLYEIQEEKEKARKEELKKLMLEEQQEEELLKQYQAAQSEAWKAATMEEDPSSSESASPFTSDPSSSSSSSFNASARASALPFGYLRRGGPTEFLADLEYDSKFNEEFRRGTLSKKMEKNIEWKEKERKKKIERRRKEELLLARARGYGTNRSTPLPDLDPSEILKGVDPSTGELTTDHRILRPNLKAAMAILANKVSTKDLNRHNRDEQTKQTLKQLKEARRILAQMQQMEALEKKRKVNPVEQLKTQRRRTEMPHYPKEWRQMKDKFFKT